MSSSDDGSGWLGPCVWCCQRVQGSQGYFNVGMGVCYHRGECAEALQVRFEQWLTDLKRERAEVTRPAQRALDFAA